MHKNSGGWLVSSVLVSSVVLGGLGEHFQKSKNSAFKVANGALELL